MSFSSQFQLRRNSNFKIQDPQKNITKTNHFARCRRRQIYCLHEIPDLGGADFYRARATTAPVRNRLRMPAVGHNRERFLLRHELVSARLRGKIRPRGTETSWSRGRKRSRLWPAAGILRLFLTGAVVARALYKSAPPRSGISCKQ